MKVSHKSKNGRIEVFAEGDTQKDVFRQLSSLQEVFEETSCGVCNNEDIKFIVRTIDSNDFYELHCQEFKCRARFAFGQHKSKDGTLFPKRKDKDGNWLDCRGWSKWAGSSEPKKEEVS